MVVILMKLGSGAAVMSSCWIGL